MSIASDAGTTCALLNANQVKCWGANGSGQLGNGTDEQESATPVAVVRMNGTGVLNNITSLSGDGSSTFCGIRVSKGVVCWGAGQQGQLGNGSDDSSATPVAVVGIGGSGRLGGVRSVVGESGMFCALLVSGGVDCWGQGSEGQLGDGYYSNRSTPVPVEGLGGSGTLGGVESITTDGGTVCATMTSSDVDCWGYGRYGQIGSGRDASTDSPSAVKAVDGSGQLSGVLSVATTGNFTFCATLSSGVADCWGYGSNGQLGDGAAKNADVPVAVEGVGGSGLLRNVTKVSGQFLSFCAQLASKGLDCWGLSTFGQLGDGTYSESETPVVVKGLAGIGTLTGVLGVSGGNTLCAVLTSGKVDCWGYGKFGQLGDGDTKKSATPVAVKGVGGIGVLSGVSSVGGMGTLCAILASGNVACWGEPLLGNGSTSRSSTPVEVAGIGN